MSYEDFETKMEAKGWIPTPRDVAESLKAVQTAPSTFEAQAPTPSDTPIFDELASTFTPFPDYDPFMSLVEIENEIASTEEVWETEHRNYVHLLDYILNHGKRLELTP